MIGSVADWAGYSERCGLVAENQSICGHFGSLSLGRNPNNLCAEAIQVVELRPSPCSGSHRVRSTLGPPLIRNRRRPVMNTCAVARPTSRLSVQGVSCRAACWVENSRCCPSRRASAGTSGTHVLRRWGRESAAPLPQRALVRGVRPQRCQTHVLILLPGTQPIVRVREFFSFSR